MTALIDELEEFLRVERADGDVDSLRRKIRHVLRDSKPAPRAFLRDWRQRENVDGRSDQTSSLRSAPAKTTSKKPVAAVKVGTISQSQDGGCSCQTTRPPCTRAATIKPSPLISRF